MVRIWQFLDKKKEKQTNNVIFLIQYFVYLFYRYVYKGGLEGSY